MWNNGYTEKNNEILLKIFSNKTILTLHYLVRQSLQFMNEYEWLDKIK